MNIKDYFSNNKKFSYPGLQLSAFHKETIESFYEDFIRQHLKKLFDNNKSNLIKWCEVLESYADGGLPIFWIRQFESGSGKALVNDNRRTGTTVLVDKSKNAVAAYAYISNFDAQELYNIILNVDPSGDPHEFETLMMDGDYKFHYDRGVKSNESAITSFECLAHANSLGVFNRANLYLAHVIDVNGEYNSPVKYTFESGNIADWKSISTYAGYNLSGIFDRDSKKKIRVFEYVDDVTLLKEFLKAHFFRFVHPFNYYLVPGQKYEINAIFGKTNRSVGEYSDLTNYVRYRMYVDFIKDDADLSRHYATFESNILIDDSKKLSKNFTAIETASKGLGNTVIHVIYGTSVGEEGQLLRKLSKKVINIDELYNLYTRYTVGDKFVFFESGAKTDSYKPTGVVSFVDLLQKLLSRIRSGACVEIELEKKAVVGGSSKKSASSTKSTGTKAATKKTGIGASRRGYTDADKLKLAAYYLKNNTGLQEAEKAILGCDRHGTIAKKWLNENFGIDTGRNSKHKGLLMVGNIDDAIDSLAQGKFKTALEKIKEEGLA